MKWVVDAYLRFCKMCSSGTYVFRLCFPLETRIEQVLHQLRERKAKVMYDFRTETWNIVQCR
ncbi:hypothetical protein Gura_2091 [Geotalea uraniireducens Rf4]|uniref:Uncharacterized protein n=1 Tax=Geotalea uraniireducens (strain Rf4) TaxID=351605 RepID=A5G3B3_GEOUR|nr:hypothetical protein Gura_2091 [Geotalea uraniireducens Rf4]